MASVVLWTMKLAGPFPAKLPVGIDFMGRPFSEPILLKIAFRFLSN